MIRILRYQLNEIIGHCDFPESVFICVSPVLTRDPAIVGETYLEGFIPAEIVGLYDPCNQSSCGVGATVSLKYDDQYLASYDALTEQATAPLKSCTPLGLLRDTCLKRYIDLLHQLATAV